MIFRLKKLKFKVTLRMVLNFILIIIFVAELFIAYKYIYQNLRTEEGLTNTSPIPTVRINLPVYKSFEGWLGDKVNYQIPGYELKRVGIGRDNPFAEYSR